LLQSAAVHVRWKGNTLGTLHASASKNSLLAAFERAIRVRHKKKGGVQAGCAGQDCHAQTKLNFLELDVQVCALTLHCQ
jgi:hypothetical protein